MDSSRDSQVLTDTARLGRVVEISVDDISSNQTTLLTGMYASFDAGV
jgi:hypothetical protein